MKLAYFLVAFVALISSVYSSGGSYQITFYGCPEECSTQKNPSCGNILDTDYFAALSTSLRDEYCGNYVIVMLANGSGAKTMVKAKVVDSCSECSSSHVDLSSAAFSKLISKSAGVADVIWSIYSSSGKALHGPVYSSIGSTAEKLGLSSSSFISAFKANAQQLATSSSHSKEFSASASGSSSDSHNTTTKKTTIKKTTTTTTKKITTTTVNKPTPVVNKPVPVGNNKPVPVVPIAKTTKTVPFNLLKTTAAPLATGTVLIQPTQPVQPVQPVQPIQPVQNTPAVAPTKPAESDKQTIAPATHENEGDEGNTPATVGLITAIGGSCLGAAGVGLLFMKRQNPTQYEELKQKFPEAFSNVKRGLTRSATSLKRSVTSVQRKMTTKRGTNNRKINVPSENTTTQNSSIVNIGEDGIPRFSLIDA